MLLTVCGTGASSIEDILHKPGKASSMDVSAPSTPASAPMNDDDSVTNTSTSSGSKLYVGYSCCSICCFVGCVCPASDP